MMLTGMFGACLTAPRQSRIKKPRPLKSLSIQEALAINQDDSGTNVSTDRKLSFDSLQVAVSPDSAFDQDSQVCKEIKALSSRLLTFTCGQAESAEKCQSWNHQDSGLSYSGSEQCHMFDHQDFCSPLESSASSTSVNQRRYTFSSNESPVFAVSTSASQRRCTFNQSPVSLDTSHVCRGRNSPAVNMSCNSDRDTVAVAYCSDLPKFDLKDDMNGVFSPHNSGSGRCRYHSSTPKSTGKQTLHTDTDNSQSLQDHHCGSTRATMVTDTGDELCVTGRNFKTVLLASRILLKEINANLVKIETVPDDDNKQKKINSEEYKVKSNIRRESFAASDVENEYHTPDETVESPNTKSLIQQTRWSPSWRYSKRELLRLSLSVLSRHPPPLWNMISSIHSDCCLPASEVREYFDPSSFHCHDGTLVVESFVW